MPVVAPFSFLKAPTAAQTNLFSLQFNGSSQYGTLNNVLLPNADFTFECWVKLDSAGLQPIFSSSTDGSHYWILIARNAGPNALTLQYDVGAGGVFISAGAALSTAAWIHIALTRDGDDFQWYIDGAASGGVTTDSVSTLDENPTQEIARYTSLYWPGRIDELRIWDVARTAGQIAAYKGLVIDPSTSDLTGYWRFESGAGTTATDELGLNDATLVGTPTWSGDVPF